MTISDEGKQLRNDVARLRPDKRRRYSHELRGRILDWVKRATATGMTEPECAKAIGVRAWRFTLWRRDAMAVADEYAKSLALVQIETPAFELTPAVIAVVAPSGHRVEGLSLGQVITLLRELA
jgi:hypothetical protein